MSGQRAVISAPGREPGGGRACVCNRPLSGAPRPRTPPGGPECALSRQWSAHVPDSGRSRRPGTPTRELSVAAVALGRLRRRPRRVLLRRRTPRPALRRPGPPAVPVGPAHRRPGASGLGVPRGAALRPSGFRPTRHGLLGRATVSPAHGDPRQRAARSAGSAGPLRGSSPALPASGRRRCSPLRLRAPVRYARPYLGRPGSHVPAIRCTLPYPLSAGATVSRPRWHQRENPDAPPPPRLGSPLWTPPSEATPRS